MNTTHYGVILFCLCACEGKATSEAQQTGADSGVAPKEDTGAAGYTSDGTNGGAGQGGSGVGGQGACGPETCVGCCDTSTTPPTCRSGTDRWRCGTQGEFCADCKYKKCDAAAKGGGTCVHCPHLDCMCSPFDCPTGCCGWANWSDFEQCLPGSSPLDCGKKGEECKRCDAGQTCAIQEGGDGYECVAEGNAK